MLYLHHQWSDESHILQSCSTYQYSKTVEYEAPTPFSSRVIVTLPLIFWILPDLNRAVRHEFIQNFRHIFNFQRIDLQDECIDSISTFFGDKLYTYSLQENYTGAIRSTLESVKIKVYKNLRKCPGNPDPPTWRSWYEDGNLRMWVRGGSIDPDITISR